MNGLKSTLVIDIWSDLVCPWCWIAKKRFEQALVAFEHKDDVVIRHHSFRISNDKPALPFPEALNKKFGNKLAADNMMNQVVAAGKMEGLTYNFDTMLFGDTEDALTLVAAARQVDLGEQLMERFFQASIEEGRSIFDHDELISLAEEVGISRETARKAFTDNALRASISDDELAARTISASGVPLFVFNSKYAISGAQPAEYFLSAMRKCLEESKIQNAETGYNSSCSIDGCGH